MRELMLRWARQGVRAAGFNVSRANRLPLDLDQFSLDTIRFVRPYTMSSPEQVHAMCEAVRYVVDNGVPGEIVECGVWRGGSMMAAARVLLERRDTSRRLRLFDTFEGMVSPGPNDLYRDGSPANDVFDREVAAAENSKWCDASMTEVRHAMSLTGYPEDQISYVAGPVEDTLPGAAPEQVAVLRLDTDWYESTRLELSCLYPRLAPGGVLIVDDYGYWQGVRRAVDEYFSALNPRPLLMRIDFSARMAVVPGWLEPRSLHSGEKTAARRYDA